MNAQPSQSEAPSCWNWFKYVNHQQQQDPPKDVQNALLVVAALIAAVTFQAGVNPPGGVWQDDDEKRRHVAGEAIWGCKYPGWFSTFVCCNTFALSSSITLIGYVASSFPFQLETWIAIISILVCYCSSVLATSPSGVIDYRYFLLAASGPIILRMLLTYFRKVGNKSG